MMVAIAEKLQGDLPMGYMDVSKSTGEKDISPPVKGQQQRKAV